MKNSKTIIFMYESLNPEKKIDRLKSNIMFCV